MRKTTINCDTCNADLTDAGPMPTYYLSLQSVRMPTTSNTIYAVHRSPPIAGNMDFCSKKCLGEWFNRN